VTPGVEPRLAIDADAGARRLSGGELEGPWQVPAELARRAFRAGARRVAVTCDRNGFTVRDDGPALDAGTLAAVGHALRRDASAASAQRTVGDERADDEALARLESGPHAELRFLAALPGASVDVTCRSGVAITVSGVRWERERAREWLRSVGRFAAPAIELDGRTLAPHSPGGLAREPLAGPWPGEVALTATGDDGAIWLLADRMVSAFLVVAGGFPFEAVVDVSGAGPARSAADLRGTIAPLVPALIEQAARMTRDLARHPGTLDPAAAARVRVLVLKAARLPRWRGEALRAAVYPARTGSREHWLSLADLGRTEVTGTDRRMATCAPASVPMSLFLAEAPAAILEPAERGRLSQELGLRFRVLPRAETAPVGRAWPASLRDWAGRLIPGGPILSDDALDPAERRLLDALRRTGIDVRIRSGRRAPRRLANRVLLSRSHPAVRAAVESVARDPAWAFPAVVALLGRLGTEGARSAWRARAGVRLAAPSEETARD
jgi:hypothetical protein